MGLSSFWTAIKRQRFNEPSESRKHVDRVYDHHHTIAPVRGADEEPPHHYDAIYDTHHHILPSQKMGPKRHTSSPPRIHSPTTTKQHKKPNLWKSASLSVKPSQQTDSNRTEESVKRRSFWHHEQKPTTTAPPVRRPDPISNQTSDKKSKRNSFWRSSPEEERLTSNGDTSKTDLKSKRSSLRLSLRRTNSSKSRNSLRFSFLAGGADDSDDEGIPALPPIPVNLQRQKSRSKDPGRHLSLGRPVVQPGTAVTSDDVYGISSPSKSSNSVKRSSLSRLITSRKSASDLSQEDKSTNKRKRRSWFSVHDSESSPDTAIPPVPALPGAPTDPSDAAFHRFLYNIHNAAPKGVVATDYERFLDASRAFDASIPIPQHTSRRGSHAELLAPKPRPISTSAATALPALKRSTMPPPRIHGSRCRPMRPETESEDLDSPTRPFLSNEQQREWNKLREIMDDNGSPDSSDMGDDEDGVMGMIRELSRDEEHEKRARDHEKRAREDKRRRDRERYLGVGAFENKDSLARLEFGMAR